jgi:hypothetical protein
MSAKFQEDRIVKGFNSLQRNEDHILLINDKLSVIRRIITVSCRETAPINPDKNSFLGISCLRLSPYIQR